MSLKAGETAHAFVAWSVPINSYRVASPLLYRDCLYSLDQQRGIVPAWMRPQARTLSPAVTRRDRITASPLANDGRIYLVDQNGLTVVVEAGPELHVIGRNELNEMCWSSPAVAGDNLLIRTVDALYCIGRD